MIKRKFKVASFMLLFALSFLIHTVHTQATILPTFNSDKPRVVLDGFIVSGDVVVPGENFDLTFTLRNPSNTYSVNSILLTFTNELVVPIYGQDDQIYIDTIPAGGTQEVIITLEAVEKIIKTGIKFEIDVTFSDEEHSNNRNLITIQLPITKTSKFEIQNVSYPENVYIGNKTRVLVTYKNTGVDDFYNIIMNINGEEFETIQQVSLGSLVAGEISYSEAYVDFVKFGEQKADISFNYEDIEGNKFTSDGYEMNFTALESGAQESKEAAVIDATSSAIGPITPKLMLCTSIGVMTIIVLVLLLKYKK